MIGAILNAVLQECRELLSGTGAMVIMKTNFKNTKDITNSMDLILLDLQDAPDSVQYPGGLTRMDWIFSFNSYSYMPDSYVDDTTGYSTALLDFIDTIRVHFSTGQLNAKWLTQGMYDVQDLYGFQFTLTGLTVAEALDQDGLIMGYKQGFDSTSFDGSTLFMNPSLRPLERVVQTSEPPPGPDLFLVNSDGDFLINSNGEFLITA